MLMDLIRQRSMLWEDEAEPNWKATKWEMAGIGWFQ